MKKEDNLTEAEIIKEFVDDHFSYFGAYPMQVETDKGFYTWDEYWAILESAKVS